MGKYESELALRFTSQQRWSAPRWAFLQQEIFGVLNQAAPEFVQRYTRKDGTLIWRDDWPGMDGSDDPYEGFKNLVLFYVLGGSEEALKLGRQMWETITWQWTEYGQVYREFDAYYDWMHHGESYVYLYFLGLADYTSLMDRQRAVKFASFYDGTDAEALNYDPEKRIIRSPINGSRGPRFETTEEDWCTHRGILENYLPPFEDLPNVPFPSDTCPWSDDRTYRNIIQKMNDRMMKGDVPLNLTATSLMTHAYLHTGDERYKAWVIEYHDAWKQRTKENGGIIPDNIGLDGKIGSTNDGKWWGGYYGWRWPHGFMTIMEPLLIAGMNSYLLTGDESQLDLARSQLDMHWGMRKRRDEIQLTSYRRYNDQWSDEMLASKSTWLSPYRKFDSGWHDYRPINGTYPIHLWSISMNEEDAMRAERIGEEVTENTEPVIPIGVDPKTGQPSPRYPRKIKHFIANGIPWFNYVRGRNPDYPEKALETNLEFIFHQLQRVRSEEGDPSTWALDGYNIGTLSSIHKWQDMCPIMIEQLAQLTLGAPMYIAHGGLQHARVRYFDGELSRPGLPQGVSALVEHISKDKATVQLVNMDQFSGKTVIVQAGMFGEHQFTTCSVKDQNDNTMATFDVHGKWLTLRLEPGCGVILHAGMALNVGTPSYETPWVRSDNVRTIQGRKHES